jgi:hypothetical protein
VGAGADGVEAAIAGSEAAHIDIIKAVAILIALITLYSAYSN